MLETLVNYFCSPFMKKERKQQTSCCYDNEIIAFGNLTVIQVLARHVLYQVVKDLDSIWV